jgi:hypothetical protein
VPTTPSPEPWKRPSKSHAHRYDAEKNRSSFYDANGKLVGYVIVREAEKYGGKRTWRYGSRQRRDRIITCVNACQGIPSELLAGDGLLHMAIQLMRRACDFGDLHLQTLPDRIAANMTDLYHGTILKERIADVRLQSQLDT